MKSTKTINRSRKFSKDFKLQIVSEFESHQFTALELSKLYSIHSSLIYKWVRKFSKHQQPPSVIVEMKNSSTKKLKDYQDKIEELERIVGQKQIQIDFLDQIIDCANEYYQTDLKKTLSTKPSSNSNQT